MNDDQFDQLAERMRADRAAEIGEYTWRHLAPAKFLTASIDGLPDTCRPAITEWAHGPEGRNLIIVGPVGTGKTWAALAAVRPFVEAGASVQFWPVVELLDGLRPSSPQPADVAAIANASLLVLDDLGTERPTEWTLERMYLIVNHRWMHNLPTVVTSNAPTSDAIADQVGERMRSRLVGSSDVVVRLAGVDRRRFPTPTTEDARP